MTEPDEATAARVPRAKIEVVGDGKIFVLPLMVAIRIRTGEAGNAAL